MFNSSFDSNSHYLILSEKERSYGVYILSCGYQKCKPHTAYPPHEHPGNYLFTNKKRVLREYQLVYISEGKGVLYVGEHEYEVTKGSVLFIMPGQAHYYCPDQESGWEEYFIGFDGDTAKDFILENFHETKNLYRTGIDIELTQLFHTALTAIRNDEPMLQFRLSGIVMHMLGLLSYNQLNRLNYIKNHQQVAEKAKKIMSDHINGHLNPEDISQKLQLSYSGFRTIFKSQTGYSPARYFRLLKIQKAKQYLNETDLAVDAIAKLLNFNSTHSFLVCFKKNTGVTPLDYKMINDDK